MTNERYADIGPADIEKQMTISIEAALVEAIGDHRSTMAINAARLIQIPATVMFYREMKAGGDIHVVASTIAGALGTVIAQMMTAVHPDARDDMYQDLTDTVEASVNAALGLHEEFMEGERGKPNAKGFAVKVAHAKVLVLK